MASQDVRKQFRGICQCCGREQAVVSGCMSKHGYQVKEGWFQGVCSGERFKPMQKSRDQADAIIKSVREECIKLRAAAAELLSGKRKPKEAQSGNTIEEVGVPRWKWKAEMVPFDQAPKYYQDRARAEAVWKSQRRAEIGEGFAEQLERLADEYYGKELREVAVDAGPAPINIGERRVSARGVLAAVSIDKGRVYWKDDRGFKSWMGSQAWRKLPMDPAALAAA